MKKDISLVRSLHQKKYRNETGLFIAEGRKLVLEAMASGLKVEQVYTTEDSFAEQHPGVTRIPSADMQKMSALATPPGYLAVIQKPVAALTVPDTSIVLVLDGISDPGNMGTIIRTADWFGIRHIYCTPLCVEVYNPKVVQSSMGSIFRTLITELDEEGIIGTMKKYGITLVGAELQGTSLFEYEFPQKCAIVIGSESQGISGNLKNGISDYVTIPGKGTTESLNASVAASIIMAEAYRKKLI